MLIKDDHLVGVCNVVGFVIAIALLVFVVRWSAQNSGRAVSDMASSSPESLREPLKPINLGVIKPNMRVCPKCRKKTLKIEKLKVSCPCGYKQSWEEL